MVSNPLCVKEISLLNSLELTVTVPVRESLSVFSDTEIDSVYSPALPFEGVTLNQEEDASSTDTAHSALQLNSTSTVCAS